MWLTLGTHPGVVQQCSYSHDGRKVLTVTHGAPYSVLPGGGDNTVRVWEAATGKPLLTLKWGDGPWGLGSFFNAGFTSDDNWIRTAKMDHPNEYVQLFNAETGAPLLSVHDNPKAFGTPRFNRESAVGFGVGRMLAWYKGDASCDPQLWSSSGELLAILKGLGDGLQLAAMSPDGQRVLTVQVLMAAPRASDYKTCLWDAANGNLVAQLRPSNRIYTFLEHFSPDSRYVLTHDPFGEDEEKLRVWDAATGTEVCAISGESEAWFSPDSRSLLIEVSGENKSRLFSLTNRQEFELTGTPLRGYLPLSSHGFSADSRWAFSVQPGDPYNVSFYAWNVLTGKNVFMRRISASIPRWFVTEGRVVVADGAGFSIWTLSDGNEIAHNVRTPGKIEFSPDGRHLVPCSWDGNPALFEIATGQELPLGIGRATDLAYSPDGEEIIAARGDVADIWHRRRPEYGWGIAWLPEFWLGLFLFAMLLWSVRRDRQTLRGRLAPAEGSQR